MKIEKIVVDTSALIEGVLSKRIEENELVPNLIIIHEASIAELEAQANMGREVGFLGLEEIKKITHICAKKKINIKFLGNKPTIEEITLAKKGGIDAMIRNLAFDLEATLLTVDKIQALTSEAKGIPVILVKMMSISERPLLLEKYFDSQTMSVHLKENCTPKAKKGMPGNWTYTEVADEKLSIELMKAIAKDITEHAGIDRDGFIEIERKHSTIVQLGRYRIVITRPPFSDGYEITIVRPVKKLNFDEYNLSPKLKMRIEDQAEGVLIAGAPGHGKSTFAQALAEFYLAKSKVIKTVEAPRDLLLKDEVTQYAISHGTYAEIHDILLLSRPDYTLFDEMRNTADFKLFSDLRLAGVGMIGIVHATKPIDAIQRFIGRIELGVIPHIMDTVIFIKNGMVDKVFSVSMEVKVPSGMVEADLARPIVVINDFETGKLEYEIYSYGEETVVIPVQSDKSNSPAAELASRVIKEEFKKYTNFVKVEMVSNNKCAVYVPKDAKAAIIGRQGSNIEAIEKRLGISIDVREIVDDKKTSRTESIPYQIKIDKQNITFNVRQEYADKDTDIVINDEVLLTVKSAKKAMIKINKHSPPGREIWHALNEKRKIELKQ